jgi:hypothetical protein
MILRPAIRIIAPTYYGSDPINRSLRIITALTPYDGRQPLAAAATVERSAAPSRPDSTIGM